MKKAILYLAVFMLFAACEKEVRFKGEVTEPLLVLNGFAQPDSLLVIRLTASRFFLEEVDSFVTVKDAHLRLYVDGTYKEDLQSQKNGYYISSYRPKQGEVLSIEAEAPGFESVRAEALLPVVAELLKVDTSITLEGELYDLSYDWDPEVGDYIIDTIGLYTNYQVSMTLSFRDPPTPGDYYRVVVKHFYGKEYYDGYYDFTVENFYTAEMGDLLGPAETQNEYQIYADELYNGKTVDLKLSFAAHTYRDYQGELPNSTTSIQVQLQNISPSYYLYLKTFSEYSNSIDFFSEPIQVFSNVSGGIGIFGAYSSNVIELKFN
ncbi:MAG TPA: DUF4249 domain-containing protein [Bacteroidales bacterium]|nr:DUF4249 domain-containing protein [Bacteroidales bacterium]